MITVWTLFGITMLMAIVALRKITERFIRSASSTEIVCDPESTNPFLNWRGGGPNSDRSFTRVGDDDSGSGGETNALIIEGEEDNSDDEFADARLQGSEYRV